MGEILDSVPGDWTSGATTRACRAPDCGGGDACKAAAFEVVVGLAYKLICRRKVTIPALNRWWKCCPGIRKIAGLIVAWGMVTARALRCRSCAGLGLGPGIGLRLGLGLRPGPGLGPHLDLDLGLISKIF